MFGSTCEVPHGVDPGVAIVEQPGVMRPKFLGNCEKFSSHPAAPNVQPGAPSAISLPFRSLQVTDADWSRMGLSAAATPLVAESWYLLTLNLIAVFALPNRS